MLRNYLLTSTVSLYSFSYRSGNCGMDSNDQILVNLLHLNHHETIYSIGRDLLPVSMMKRSKLIFFGIILYVLHAIHHVVTGITRDHRYNGETKSMWTRGPPLKKIAYVISKSFDFIEIKMISSDFNKDFRLQKSIKCVGDSTRDILLGAY